MGGYVADASVAVKWILVEDDSDRAEELLDLDETIYAPSLIQVEVASAITRRHRLSMFSEAETRVRLADAADVFSGATVQLLNDDVLLSRAGEIALLLRHPLQDCLYVSCAERVEATLITADRTLHKRASAHFDFIKLL